MGQEIRGVPQDPPLTSPDGAKPAREDSIGRYLAQQRRLRGVSLDELAAQTRIPRRSLERLEDGAFDRQADGFARGFVRTVAAALGLDAEEAVMRLLDEPAADEIENEIRRLALQRWAVASVLLLSGTAAIFGIWALWTRDSSDGAGAVSSEIVYRPDAVRELAEEMRAFGTDREPLESHREGHPD
jgi:hypothetical protein